jgi:hypothetical protein
MAATASKTGNIPCNEYIDRQSYSLHHLKCFLEQPHFREVMDALMVILFHLAQNYSTTVANPNVGIAVGMNKGHIVRRRELPPRPSRRKGILSQKTKAVRSLIKEVCG